jgi:hypothetical protein
MVFILKSMRQGSQCRANYHDYVRIIADLPMFDAAQFLEGQMMSSVSISGRLFF